MMKTYKFRIYPSKKQVDILNTTLNLCCEMYNAMLEQRIYAYKLKKRANYVSQVKEIPAIKERFPEYRNIYSQVIQDVLRRLDKTYDNFFRRVKEKKQGKHVSAGFPRFKPKGRYNSITYPQSGFKLMDNGHVLLSKIGELRVFMHRPIIGNIKTTSIKRDSVGDWFITFTVQTDITHDNTEPTKNWNMPKQINPIGVDLGLKALITTSDGMQIEPAHFLKKSERKLKKAQRDLSRKQKGSGKRRKAKIKVAKIHRKIERQRDDFSHKLSRNLVENHGLIVFEDLNIKSMIENLHLAKSITDASWNKIMQYTMYKTESAGAVVVFVDPMHTSQTCSKCGSIKNNLKLSDRTYHCDTCGLVIDRDLNAAMNIERKGIEKFKKTTNVGRGTPEFTPVEIGSLPARANPIIETGSPHL